MSTMEIPAIIVILPLGLLFLLSGLVVNLIQAILCVLVRPFSMNIYRELNKIVAELLLLEAVWLFDWWAGVKVELHTDPETFHLMGKEHALLISNHRSDIDWLVGWILAQRAGCLGTAVALMKDVLKYLPVIGWLTWFSGYVFVKRKWAEDESTLKVFRNASFCSFSGHEQLLCEMIVIGNFVTQSGYEKLKDFPVPFWLALFVEGTRFTQAKLLDAQQYAICKGLPAPRNVLLPRTKGLVLAVKHLRPFITAVYNVTLTVARDEPPPSMMSLFKGKSSVVKVDIKRHLMHELPDKSDGVAQWCKDLFVAKDEFLENYYSGGSFGGQQLQDIGRPKTSLIVIIVWSCLLISGAVGFLLWTRLFSTWKGTLLSAAFLLLVTVIMQIFILFSQSEPNMDSIPIKLIPQDPMKEILLQK